MPDLQPYYQNDLVTLYKGDCLEIMPKLNITFDACITDPPYGTTACKWDSVIPFEPMWDNLKRLVKSNGAICLFGSEPFSSFLICSMVKFFKEKLTWAKHKPSNFACGRFQHMKYSEDIIVFRESTKGAIYNPQKERRLSERVSQGQKNGNYRWSSVRKENEVSFGTNYLPKPFSQYDANFKLPSNILNFYGVQSNSKEKCDHPTQKPVPLIEYLIKTYTNENETILDFTCGSGTTGVAAMNTNRRCVLIEQEEKYCDITIQRLQQTEKQIAERLF